MKKDFIYNDLDIEINNIDDLKEIARITRNLRCGIATCPIYFNDTIKKEVYSGKKIILHFRDNIYYGWDYFGVPITMNDKPVLKYAEIKNSTFEELELLRKLY